jgi:[acyl-carrier-protein] S-malonyltransferase
MAVSLAVIRVLEAEVGLDLARDAKFVAGHSLGEYSALAAAGAFTLADTARLLRLRGEAMQKAVPVGEGAMAALARLSRTQQIADKDVISIDMRVPGRIAARLSEEAAALRAEAQAKKPVRRGAV